MPYISIYVSKRLTGMFRAPVDILPALKGEVLALNLS
jgi:hypothetical protein